MARIASVSVLSGLQLRVVFDDGVVRLFDGPSLLGHSALTAPLYDPALFAQVAIYPHGDGLYWPNQFDMCPDWLRYHAPVADTQNSELAAVPRG